MARGQLISSADEAETLALNVLAWLVSDDDLVQSFAMASGALPATFGELATSRAFLVSLLEFLTSDDQQVLAFTSAANLEPMAPLEALRMLQGRAGMNWT
ncbi:MAG: DUF3572 family protein [Deltaproteobacteria bacterium]